jgi:hypothetical protein
MIEDDLDYLAALAEGSARKLDDKPTLKATVEVFVKQVEVAKGILSQARDPNTTEERREALVKSVGVQRARLARFLLDAQIRPLRRAVGREERRRLEAMERNE